MKMALCSLIWPKAKWQECSSWDFLPGGKIRASSDKIAPFPRGHYTCPASSREFILGDRCASEHAVESGEQPLLLADLMGEAQKRPRCSQMCSKADMPWWPVSPVSVTYLDSLQRPGLLDEGRFPLWGEIGDSGWWARLFWLSANQYLYFSVSYIWWAW